MKTAILDKLDAEVSKLSFLEQLELIEILARKIRLRSKTSDEQFADELNEMANDPQMQRELRKIEAEFSATEMDGLHE